MKRQKISLRLPPEVVKQLDEESKKDSRSRTNIIELAVVKYLESKNDK